MDECHLGWKSRRAARVAAAMKRSAIFLLQQKGVLKMKGPAIPVMGIWLRREGDYTVVYVEKEDGKRYEAIREHWDGAFSHHISESGLANLHKLDHIQPGER